MILDILTEPNPILRQAGRKLSAADISDPKFRRFIDDLTETMYEKDGVGIASPQTGESIMMCVIAKNFTPDKTKDLVLINPVWEKRSVTRVSGEEGCLSVPLIYGKVKRYKKIKVNALDENGSPVEFDANDFFARIIQHEIDHLNGILFIDKAKGLYKIEKKI